MSTEPKTYANVGSVSHGTLRNVDLIQACTRELEWLTQAGRNDRSDEESQLIRDGYEWVSQNLDNDVDSQAPDHFCNGDEILGELSDALERYAPENCYFGMHVGDGSDIGFWPLEEGML